MALTAPSSTLTGQTIAASYDQVLFLDAAAGVTEATLKIVSGTAGKTALQISDEHVLIKGVDTNNAAGFEVQQTDGTSILKVAAGTPAATLIAPLTVGADGSGHDVIFYSGTAGDNFTWDASEECLIITGTDAAQALKVADGDLVVVDKIYLYDNDGGEYLSSDGTDLTITSGNDIVLTATSVGIGQSTPASPNSIARFLHIGSSGDAHSSIVMEDNANTWELLSNDAFSILDGTSEHLTILNTGNVGIGDSDPSEAKLSITGVASGDAGIKIDQDQNNYALEIDSEATTAASIYIAGNTATTTPIIMVDDADALTTGNILKLYSNSSDNSARKLVYIINDHAATDNTTGLHIQQDGNGSAIEISGAGNGGIKFSGGASSDANTLDDYEEGTWTAVVTDGSNTLSFSANTCGYIKVGKLVFISGRLVCDGLDGASSAVSITNLPFATKATNDGASAISIGYLSGMGIEADTTVVIRPSANSNAATFFVWDGSDSDNVTGLTASEFSANGQLQFGGTYQSAA